MARTRNRTPKKDWAKAFLQELARTGSVLHSARKVKKGRRTVYDRREVDSAFEVAWDEAIAIANDFLEVEARRRATEGTLRAVFQGGKLVGKVRDYSDTLLIFLLKAHDPKFRDTSKITLNGDPAAPIPHTVSGVLDVKPDREAFLAFLNDIASVPTDAATTAQPGTDSAG